MLNLTRYPGQKIIVTHKPTGEKIVIEVGAVNPDKQVRLCLSADQSFVIDREEIHLDKIRGTKNDNARNDGIQRDTKEPITNS
jgi:sRNA-binding carbon storage regulator CsrA